MKVLIFFIVLLSPLFVFGNQENSKHYQYKIQEIFDYKGNGGTGFSIVKDKYNNLYSAGVNKYLEPGGRIFVRELLKGKSKWNTILNYQFPDSRYGSVTYRINAARDGSVIVPGGASIGINNFHSLYGILLIWDPRKRKWQENIYRIKPNQGTAVTAAHSNGKEIIVSGYTIDSNGGHQIILRTKDSGKSFQVLKQVRVGKGVYVQPIAIVRKGSEISIASLLTDSKFGAWMILSSDDSGKTWYKDDYYTVNNPYAWDMKRHPNGDIYVVGTSRGEPNLYGVIRKKDARTKKWSTVDKFTIFNEIETRARGIYISNDGNIYVSGMSRDKENKVYEYIRMSKDGKNFSTLLSSPFPEDSGRQRGLQVTKIGHNIYTLGGLVSGNTSNWIHSVFRIRH